KNTPLKIAWRRPLTYYGKTISFIGGNVALSAPGIGSNLDINAIISQLMAVESRPLQQLATKEASYKAKLTALGSLQGALGTFQTALNDLGKDSKFQSMSVSSSDTALLKA